MFATILGDLRQRYGDKILLTPEDLEGVLGISRGQQANLRSQGRFPLPTRKVGGRICVSIYDLAKYLAGAAEEDVKAQMTQEQATGTKKSTRSEKKAKRGLLEKNWWLFRAHHITAILDSRRLLDSTNSTTTATEQAPNL